MTAVLIGAGFLALIAVVLWLLAYAFGNGSDAARGTTGGPNTVKR